MQHTRLVRRRFRKLQHRLVRLCFRLRWKRLRGTLLTTRTVTRLFRLEAVHAIVLLQSRQRNATIRLFLLLPAYVTGGENKDWSGSDPSDSPFPCSDTRRAIGSNGCRGRSKGPLPPHEEKRYE